MRIDTRPAVTPTGLQPDNHSGWRTTSQTVSLATDDMGGSGVAATYYTLDGGPRSAYSGAFVVSSDGRHRVTYWAVDALGNVQTPHIGYVNIDATAPSTTAVGLSADDHSGWNASAQTMSLSAVDALSGVAATYYTIDGGDVTAYEGEFTVSADGAHPVTYWSVDAVGNVEAAGSGYVNIDTAAPATTAAGLEAGQHSGWRTADQTVTLSAVDGGSGVSVTTYTLDGGEAQTYTGPFTVSGAGQHQVTYASTDMAGNVETTHSGWVNISNPFAQAGELAGDAHSDWHTGSATVGVTAAGDNGPFTIHFRMDGGDWQVSDSPWTITVSADGSHRIDYYAQNSVGLESIHQTGYVNIDTTAPATTASGLQASAASGWRNAPQSVTLLGDDAGLSGVAATYYTLDGGPRQSYTGAFEVSAAGSHTIVYWSVDAAGNSETPHTGFVNLDTQAPSVASDADLAWHNSAVTVHLSPADAGGSGVAATQYRAQGSATWLPAASDAFTVAAPADGSGDGPHAYEFRALDAAGNESATGSCTVRIDTQGPAVADDADVYWHNGAVNVTLTASDTGSGVQAIRCRPQGAATWTVVPGGRAVVTAPAPTDGLPNSYVYEYQSSDRLGTVSALRTFTVNMDTRMPNTALSGLPVTVWTNHEVSLTITATPGDGAPIERTEYSLNGGSWTAWPAGAALVISAPGGRRCCIARSAPPARSRTRRARRRYASIPAGPPASP